MNTANIFPYMYDERKTFNVIVDYFIETHEDIPNPSIEGTPAAVERREKEFPIKMEKIWTEFRDWWKKSTENEKKLIANKAIIKKLKANPELTPIPDNVWEKVLAHNIGFNNPPYWNE